MGEGNIAWDQYWCVLSKRKTEQKNYIQNQLYCETWWSKHHAVGDAFLPQCQCHDPLLFVSTHLFISFILCSRMKLSLSERSGTSHTSLQLHSSVCGGFKELSAASRRLGLPTLVVESSLLESLWSFIHASYSQCSLCLPGWLYHCFLGSKLDSSNIRLLQVYSQGRTN